MMKNTHLNTPLSENSEESFDQLYHLVLNLKPNPNQIKSNFTWILGEGEYLRGWGLGIKCLIEWNEIIDLLSNEGLFVIIKHYSE